MREKSEPVEIDCSHCAGLGVVELTGVYADTLKFLRQQSKPLNGAELARLAGVATTAMCNRLIWLEARGLAVSERYGSQKRWRAKR